jgi:type IV pilus assembly protein PilC
MAEFVIKLADERGRVQEQVHSASTAEELRARFTHAGYHVFSIRAKTGFGGLNRGKVKLEPFLIFNQQFLTLIRAGLPILGSLQMLAKIQKNAQFSGQLDDVSNRVKNGDALSGAFEAQSGFPVMYTTTLLAGERSGNLQEVLERYVSFQKVSLTFRKKLTASLIYPSLLMTLVIGLMIFLLAVVVPQFAVLYDQMGSKLPAMTVDLLTFGTWFHHYFIWLFLAALGIGYGGYRFSITERGRDLPSGAVCAYALHAADRRFAAGAFAGDGGPLHLIAAGVARGLLVHRHSPRGQEPGRIAHQHRGLSRPGRGDDYRGGADRRFAADAQLGGRVLRGRRFYRADRRAGAH